MKQKAWWKVILKLSAALLMGLMAASFLFTLLSDAWEGNWEDDKPRMLDICDRAYYDRDFAGLREDLELFGLYGPEFQQYWEIVCAYDAYLSLRQWQKAAECFLPGGEEGAEECRTRLYSALDEAQFPANRGLIQDFIRQAEAALPPSP